MPIPVGAGGTPAFIFTAVIEADFTGTAFGDTPTWTVVTDDVLSTGIGAALEIDQWRRDEFGVVSPGECNFVLDNSTGDYTPGLASSSYYPNIVPGVRVRVSSVIDGTQTYLFDGYVDSFSLGYVAVVKPVVRVKATDLLGRYGTDTPLRSIYEEEVLADDPLAFYPLTEPEGSTSAGDVSGNMATAAVVTNSKYGAGTLVFGVDSFPASSGAVSMTSTSTGSTSAALGTYLKTASGLIPSASAFSVETWFNTTSTESQTLVHLVGTTEQFVLRVYDTGSERVLRVLASTAIGGFDLQSAASVDDGEWHHAVVTMASDLKTGKLYLDGALVDSSVSANVTTFVEFVTEHAHVGLSVYRSTIDQPFQGRMSAVAFYPSAISLARVTSHYEAGSTLAAGETTDEHIERLLTYRPNLGTDLDTGVGTTGAHNTDGVTLQEALLATGKAEVGVVYVDGEGQVVMRSRSALFNPDAVLTLDASVAGEVTTDTEWRVDAQDVVNDATVSRPGGATQRVFDSSSQATYGIRAIDDEVIVATDEAALDIANWRVNQGKDAFVSTPNVGVFISGLAYEHADVANAVLALRPLDRLDLSDLPDTAPDTAVFVQGRHITLAVDGFDVQFYTTPVPPLSVLVWDAGTWDSDVWGF